MRLRTPAAVGVTMLAALCCATGAPAKAGPHSCAATRTAGLQVSRIRTSLRCAQAHKVLKALLRAGADKLPPKRRRSRRWGCAGKGGERWTCTRQTRAGKLRISFVVRAV